ncbi:unnamed protein product [Adineta steineri]|uniref:Glutamine synthetase n=1 Tax=Adineta steineri TaxID=433720 RepID=A0A814KR64_9BILA|nr:unnamed protein product [Adineta steineri]CAF1165775.1 unnamed protein product [Adineta steineri]CAF1351379.1 unnamed protein product [Adineta steineri]
MKIFGSTQRLLLKNVLESCRFNLISRRTVVKLQCTTDIRPLDKLITNKYLSLPQPSDKLLATYIWIDGTGEQLRAKTQTISEEPRKIEDLSWWTFDGSSTEQAKGANSDIYLKPVAIFKDPFMLGAENKLVLCETYDSDKKPTKTNLRAECEKSMKSAADQKPAFGFEQEYTLLDRDGWPFGWPKNAFPAAQGPYYCGVGACQSYGRDLVEAHYRACLYAGLDIFGSNAEVMPSQWEYQIGPTRGVAASDQLWISRFILHRIAEEYGIQISFDPKPIETGDWNGAGCHANFSTEAMGKPGGLELIKEAVEKLSHRHEVHMKHYDPCGGSDNKRRLTGKHETASYEEFSSDIASRAVSVRIPRQVAEKQYGYLEDRRPSANCDPYAVSNILVKTICLNETTEEHSN